MSGSVGAILKAWLVAVCVLVTGPQLARAQDSQWDNSWAEQGVTARAGTSVGFSELAQHRWTTLGGQLAVGYRLGPLVLEGEYDNSKLLYYTGLDNQLRGQQKRLGAALRFYFMELGRFSSPVTSLQLFADIASGLQRGSLEGQAFARSDLGAGFGWLFDHRVKRKGLGVERIGWHFGWRFTGTTRASEGMARVICGKKCPPDPMPVPSAMDLGLAVSSSLSLSW